MGKPETITLQNGETYRVMILEVVESDGRGPRLFRRLHEDESVKVENDMAFWIVYAHEDVLRLRTN